MSRLDGMAEIASYFGYSHSTILALIRNQDFPARKVTGGIWMSDTDLIDKWRKNQIMVAPLAPPKPKKLSRAKTQRRRGRA